MGRSYCAMFLQLRNKFPQRGQLGQRVRQLTVLGSGSESGGCIESSAGFHRLESWCRGAVFLHGGSGMSLPLSSVAILAEFTSLWLQARSHCVPAGCQPGVLSAARATPNPVACPLPSASQHTAMESFPCFNSLTSLLPPAAANSVLLKGSL